MLNLSNGKKRLFDYLGEPYRTKTIDGEDCIYLDMGTHDVEIARGRTVKSPFDIYVWKKDGGFQIVEKHFAVKNDLGKIKELLDDIRSRYGLNEGGAKQ